MKIILAEIERPCAHASFLKTALSARFNSEVELLKKPLRADYSHYHDARGQWDAPALLKWLSTQYPKESRAFVLGLFPYDLFAGARRQVFGVAENNGRAALVSYHAFNPALEGKKDDDLLRRRLYKKCVHELGHLLGLGHCANRHCVMNQARNLLFLDRKTAEFCRHCRELFVV
ncbi:MAG: archaemetzincin [Candidatus Micrarchaeota archaeon]